MRIDENVTVKFLPPVCVCNALKKKQQQQQQTMYFVLHNYKMLIIIICFQLHPLVDLYCYDF